MLFQIRTDGGRKEGNQYPAGNYLPVLSLFKEFCGRNAKK